MPAGNAMKMPTDARHLFALLLVLAYAAAAVLLLLLAYRKLDAAARNGAALTSLFLSLALLFQPRRVVVAHATFFALFALFLPVVAAEYHTHTHSLASPASPNLTNFIDFLFHPPQTTTELHEFLWSLLIMGPPVLFALLCFHALLHRALRAVLRRLDGRWSIFS